MKRLTLTILIHFILNRGVSAMEIVAMDMKLRGMYIARQLSFKGVTFKVDEVPFTDHFTKIFNESVELVSDTPFFFKDQVFKTVETLFKK